MNATPQPDKTKRGTSADLAARIGALGQAKPAPAPERPAAPRKPPAARTGSRKRQPEPAPAEQDAPAAFYSERLSITTTAAQVQALRAARLADGIQATARLRAMIAAWQDDPKLRERINRLARDWQ